MGQVWQVRCGPKEELRITLKEVIGTWFVELRAYTRTGTLGEEPRAARDVVNVPLAQLPHLIAELTRVQEHGLRREEPAPPAAPPHPPESELLPHAPRLGIVQPIRRYPRVPTCYQVTCLPLAAPGAPAARRLLGELRDISLGGAQLQLPARLDLCQSVEVTAFVNGQVFQAQAEIVNAGLRTEQDPVTGYIRHGVRWRPLDSSASTILKQVLMAARGSAPQAAGA